MMTGTAKRALVLAVALTLSVEATARLMPGQHLAQLPNPAGTAAQEASMHDYGNRDKTCQEWTDGCRTCRGRAEGEPVCGNIGTACQPQSISCTRRNEQSK